MLVERDGPSSRLCELLGIQLPFDLQKLELQSISGSSRPGVLLAAGLWTIKMSPRFAHVSRVERVWRRKI